MLEYFNYLDSSNITYLHNNNNNNNSYNFNNNSYNSHLSSHSPISNTNNLITMGYNNNKTTMYIIYALCNIAATG